MIEEMLPAVGGHIYFRGPSPSEVWLRAWCASMGHVVAPNFATEWADKALADFLQRFPYEAKTIGIYEPSDK